MKDADDYLWRGRQEHDVRSHARAKLVYLRLRVNPPFDTDSPNYHLELQSGIADSGDSLTAWNRAATGIN